MPDHPHMLARLNYEQLVQEFPLGGAFTERFTSLSADALREQQERSFQRVVARAWQVPFYQRLWGAAGISAEDIQSLDDLPQLPVFDKHDLMASIELAPPWGDFHGIDDFSRGDRASVIMHTTSGTTGQPQVIPFGPRTREVQNLLLARIYCLQGLLPGDVMQSVYGHGLVNGGHYIREAVTHWTGALFLPAGTGIETPSVRQLDVMRDFSVTVLVGFCDYLSKLARLAADSGHDLNADYSVRMISGHIGPADRKALSDAWGGVEVFDWYGVGDTGIIAGEGPDHDGLYVMEDAHLLELLDVDSGQSVAQGESGDMVVTCLFKDDVYPIIRFNTHDVSAEVSGTSSLNLNLRRIAGFIGRSDNMIKLKGINVYPEAIGGYLSAIHHLTGEYQCRLSNDDKGELQMTVHVETSRQAGAGILDEVATVLRTRLGVTVAVVAESSGGLSAATGIDQRQKPLRLRDDRRNETGA